MDQNSPYIISNPIPLRDYRKMDITDYLMNGQQDQDDDVFCSRVGNYGNPHNSLSNDDFNGTRWSEGILGIQLGPSPPLTETLRTRTTSPRSSLLDMNPNPHPSRQQLKSHHLISSESSSSSLFDNVPIESSNHSSLFDRSPHLPHSSSSSSFLHHHQREEEEEEEEPIVPPIYQPKPSRGGGGIGIGGIGFDFDCFSSSEDDSSSSFHIQSQSQSSLLLTSKLNDYMTPPIINFGIISRPSSSASLSLSHKPIVVSSSSNRSSSVEEIVVSSCRDILVDAADHSLKAVELANTLRARVGTDMLANIRERWGGLLTLLERYSGVFRVDRVPKNDKVTLLLSNHNRVGSSSSPPFSFSRPVSSSAESHFSLSSPSSPDIVVMDKDHGNNSFIPAQQATRCLHVGNVPLHMTEVQLMKEFERFGQLDGLKLISQRNGSRRFAFITFHTVEQAITARHCMSKIHPWKSAISFAHKDVVSSSSSSSSSNYNKMSTTTTSHKSIVRSSPPLTNMNYFNHPFTQQQQQQQTTANDYNYPLPSPSPSSFQSNNNKLFLQEYEYGTADNNNNNQQHQQMLSKPFFPVTTMTMTTMDRNNNNNNPNPNNPNPNNNDNEDVILRRLCDDTYVPTQPWPINIQQDKPYCNAIIAQLQQFGGSTTVSKLRGFLRNRIAATDNIKSVPLKAMLAAYPHLFVVQSNYVSLLNSNNNNNNNNFYPQYMG